MMVLVFAGNDFKQTILWLRFFFSHSLSIHPRCVIFFVFFCFQLFCQVIGKIAVMANTHEYNNKCFSNSRQTETRQSNAGWKQRNGFKSQLWVYKNMTMLTLSNWTPTWDPQIRLCMSHFETMSWYKPSLNGNRAFLLHKYSLVGF